MGHNPPSTIRRPSDVGRATGPDEAQIRVEALQVAMRLPDAHSTSAVLKNARDIRDWIVGGTL